MVTGSPSAVVRAARVDDANAIGRIHVTSWQAAYDHALPEDFLRGLSVADRQRGWRRRLSAVDWQARALVVVDDGLIAGFACVGASRDGDASADVGELQSMYLAPEHWSQGLGQQLHSEAMATLRRDGFVRATLWVLNANERARRFYERAGWCLDEATKVDSIAGSPPVTEVRYAQTLRRPDYC